MKTLTETPPAHVEAAAAANARVSFQLTYARADQPRVFDSCELTGPPIPCAYRPGQWAPGSWDYGDWMEFDTEEEWIHYFFRVAVQEAVHEALEWFHLDGRVAVNPHGPGEIRIHDIAVQMADRLWALRDTP